MLSLSHGLLLALATLAKVSAQAPGTFVDGGNTLVSAMMLFLGSEDKVYILDKAEGNAAQVNGHPAWGAVWDIHTQQTVAMDIATNVFCASGMHLPNGSYVTFGGNGAVGPGGNIGSVKNNQGGADFDGQYQDYDGGRSIRVLNPCTSADNIADPKCQWYDDPAVLSMQKRRWYSAAEPLADGTIVLIGGFVNGGYVNRNFPNVDPTLEGGAAEPTYEFFPSRGPPVQMAFMTTTSGLNSYAHTYLMPSGKMFVQANISTILWNYTTNVETPLPNMPNNVARVYPASGAVAMLPLTPANGYTPTILFCGGSDMSADAYGDYANPAINTFDYPASRDCQRITPEPIDGSAPVYVQDDQMIDTRTMGQFIILPDGKLLVINGAQNGTAGYATQTGQTPLGQMPLGMSLAAGPVLTPSIYDPNAAPGSRWSSAGLSASTIPRLYHSSAILLPDSSVFVAGSNPNVDVNLTVPFPTTYKAEVFYPPYFSATSRPTFTGAPSTLSYGGDPFDLSIPSSAYSGSANDAAKNTMVTLVRGGFTTHAMNMGQRFLQLNNTFTVEANGTIQLHVAQMPPNPNIFQPGPALLFVVMNGIPSNGTMVIIGNGAVSPQTVSAASTLPPSVGSASASGTSNPSTDTHKLGTGMLIGIAVGGIAIIGALGAIIGTCIVRRRRAADAPAAPAAKYTPASRGSMLPPPRMSGGMVSADSGVAALRRGSDQSLVWGGSTTSLTAGGPRYRDDSSMSSPGDRTPVGTPMNPEFDPYQTYQAAPPRLAQQGYRGSYEQAYGGQGGYGGQVGRGY